MKDYVSRPLSLRSTVRDLYKRGGVLVFWRGLTASLLGLSHVAVQFPVYEFLKISINDYRSNSTSIVRLNAADSEDRSGPLDWLFASAVSKLTACTLTYPHEVIRSRMMDARDIHERPMNLIRMTQHLVKNEGWQSLYRGMHVSLLRVIPNCCLTFMSYEYFTRFATDVVLGKDTVIGVLP